MAAPEGPSRFVFLRDVTLFVGGMAGIGYQTVTGDVNPLLTGVFMAMLGLPGVGGVISAVRSTTQLPSPPPVPPSPSSQPSASRES
jgi:hypothetical protein